ncbi:aminotransferase class I/II-fold pyridoxal phosphate-dependent enzyme [Cerasicoccus fimbriatus]|uniref:aminotransferase class I/II-fold pyridoxal phosphate-dependent enzyme n=1 Tax=Cerasicoccus fimbriatus TaxID=3014554 RepID=UPI0022B59A7B|nr:aminotransferase class I/II-fold pyridoxal phosphate-dependent enzyme [Cerasicoccus sp. TK19100]
MPLNFFSKAKNSIVKRCQDDDVTRLRKRYNPYYHTFETQRGSRVIRDGKEYVMLCSNDYLGLSNHPKVLENAKRGLDEWGSSTTGARLANGSRGFHTALEEKFAAFIGKEACHISVAGYISCMSSVQSFAQKGDIVLVDKNVHSSLWAGIGLTQASVERFSHNNPADLKDVISFEKPETPKIVVFEGVYSMEGHVGRVPELLKACEGHDCFFVMDDAHGFGVMGEQGRGTANHFGLTDEIDVITGSFSKSLSSTGGFVAGSKDVIEYLRTHSKQTIFSASISPPQAYAASASLDILQNEPEHHQRLWENTRRYKEMLRSLGLDIWESETPAVPIIMGKKEKAYRFWQALLEKGVFTVISIAPAVPPGKDLIRTSISARHTEEDLEIVFDAMSYAAKKVKGASTFSFGF